MEFVIPGVAAALTMFVLMWQMDIRKFAGYHAWVDVMFTVLLFVAFNGTYSGTMTAVSGGLTLTVLLLATKYLHGYKTFDVKHQVWIFHAR
jgi:hypothetical protein